MPKTSSEHNYKTYFWMLLAVVVFATALFFLKKTGSLMMNRTWFPEETKSVQEDQVDNQIDNQSELMMESQKLDQTDVDGSINAQLKLLDQDAAGL